MFYQRQMVRHLFAGVFAALMLCSGGPGWQTRAQQSETALPAPTAQQPASPTPPKSPSPSPPAPQRPRDDNTTLPADDDDVVRVETDLTNVLFTAVDKNKRFITTLKQEDVRISEDGVPQEIFSFQRETDRPLSLAILIDTSGSQERTLPEEKSAAMRFVDAVIRPNKDEVAVLSFTGEATLEQGLTGSAARVRRAIERIEFVPPSGYVGGGVVVGTSPTSPDNQTLAGTTAIWDAIWVTADEILSETSDKTRRAIILLSDGVDTSSRLKMSEAIDRAVKNDVVIYAIGIGDSFNFEGVEEASLRKLSERSGGRAYFPVDETDLRAAFAQIQLELRSQYLLAYSSTNRNKDGSFRQLKIEVANPELRKQNLRLSYRQGYFAKTGANAPANNAPAKPTRRP